MTMPSIEAIIKSKDIEFLKSVNEQIYNRIKDLSDAEAVQKKLEFSVGDKVEWTSNKRGEVIKGTIEKFGSNNIMVRREDSMERWRVHPSFLRKQAS